jgi:very-short-patch-repair endonuclease
LSWTVVSTWDSTSKIRGHRFLLEAVWATAARCRLAQGYRVLRFRNDTVINDIEGVMRAAHEALKEA